jgi:hypothetical protein
MRMIDADEAIVNFGFEWDDICPTRDEVVSFLRKQKTISAVPVVRGEWVKSDDYKGWLVCSACHDCYVDNAWVNGKKWRYCPNCGSYNGGDNA